jgi:hypothetical protein
MEDGHIPTTMLATALVKVTDGYGTTQLCRALLDGGSTATFLSESCLQRLGLQRQHTDAEVVGISSASVGRAKGVVALKITSNVSCESYSLNALVLPRITSFLPAESCDKSNWPHLNGLVLADPDFNKPGSIDLLLGSDVFWNLLQDGRRSGPSNAPVALRSTLGWLVAGNVDSSSKKLHVHVADVNLDSRLQQFWELEAVPVHRSMSVEEEQCESHFATNHTRDATGRFTVAIPWKSPPPNIGFSRDMALRRFKSLEKRLAVQPKYREQYVDFMREYHTLGHMEVVPEEEIALPQNPTFFIPHHFVLKEDSTTTKLRVVFDASAKSSSGNSLNDAMMVGPTLQDNLVEIITRFRCHPIAFTADVAKMYRQIRIPSIDADRHRILWREDPSHPIKEYRLTTVSYGTASAPYIAVKVLQQLAVDERESLPLASEVALNDFYVDDLMSGADNMEEASKVQSELLQLMGRGGLELRKWSSNSEQLLNKLPDELREKKKNNHHNTDSCVEMSIQQEDSSIKTLGIRWNTTRDTFQFKVVVPVSEGHSYTKRRLLSEVAKLFDPLGWLAPIIITAKILIQSLWKLEVGWDESLPDPVQQQWIEFTEELKVINSLSIPRCAIPSKSHRLELAGFCDASEKAYAAVVFLVVYYSDREPHVTNLMSKTRVAPAKKISLPRLELCGAVLLSQLMSTLQKTIKQLITRSRMWTDSTIVLGWINKSPHTLQTFVANRVTEITSELPPNSWYHVPGVNNPADCASRGITPSELLHHHLWWTGPDFLRDEAYEPHSPDLLPEEIEAITSEVKKTVFTAAARTKSDVSLLERYSSLSKILRITAWILRFSNNCKLKVKTKQSSSSLPSPLTPDEINNAMMVWIRIIQDDSFHRELTCLKDGKACPTNSSILSLSPQLDEVGILRVGGRLRHAPLPRDHRHPILLPRHSRLTTLIIWDRHSSNCHAGAQLLQSIIQQQFWIPRCKDAIRYQVRRCLKCVRQNATTMTQFMGDLPAARVTPGRAFLRCGVDYAGPFMLRTMAPRSKTLIKSYLAIFVCFTTRAVHLEMVSSLSTDHFLAAFRRFIARRGCPSDVYSDCGTNFVGAAKELADLLQQSSQQVADSLSKEGIHWHFNPPGAPHFGGLWEAGVKSVKFHLHRVLGPTPLSFEEMCTLMTQIECCLNSRPLTPVSSDPNDLEALTPGHFLIGTSMKSIPDPDLSSLSIGRLDRWQLIQRLQQQFWSRWMNEFLTRLQQRPKWAQQKPEVTINDLVIIKDERLPPLKWKLARVIDLHPGPDGITRVVTLRTAEGTLKRPIAKLCLLPLDNKND